MKVVMHKYCLEHGPFDSIIERDPEWYFFCQKLNSKGIYEGYMIDVTNQCNLKCKFCYHENGNEHKSYDEIIAEAFKYGYFGPTILSGGEPTLHPDILQIINTLRGSQEFVLLTNGVKMADEKFFDEICSAGLLYGDTLLAGLSFHKESNGKDMEVLELCRKKGYKIGTTFFVIDKLEQMHEALALAREYQDVILTFRIKAASNLWAESKVSEKIFVSDMIDWFGDIQIVDHQKNNKTSYAQVIVDGNINIALISWYDKFNVDLDDINCGPWFKAKDGTINNLATSFILNEKNDCSSEN